MKLEYTENAAKALKNARSEARKDGREAVYPKHLLVGLLKVKDSAAALLLEENGVTLRKADEIWTVPEAAQSREGYTRQADAVISGAEELAARLGDRKVGTEHLLISLYNEGIGSRGDAVAAAGGNPRQGIKEAFAAIGKSRWYEKNSDGAGKISKKKAKPARMIAKFGKDLTEMARSGKSDPVVGRSKEIERAVRALMRRTKNNPCFVGEAGVGKTAIVEGLAQRIASGNVPEAMKDVRIVKLDIAAMVAGTKFRGEFEERIKGVIQEATENPDIVIFIDEIHTLIGAGSSEGSLDAANILKPPLSRGELRLVGATTFDEYRKRIERDPALERRFQKIEVSEPTVEETEEILRGIKARFEDYHGVRIEDEAVKAAAELSNRYINGRFLPDKAIDLMDEAAVSVSLNEVKEEDAEALPIEEALLRGDYEEALRISSDTPAQKAAERRGARKEERRRSVTANDISKVVAEWTGIPVGRLSGGEAARLLKLEKELAKRVVGQDEAIKKVSEAVRAGRAGVRDTKRPIGSFLFLGPTGVGKTELAKALAETVYGTEDAIIRIDMSEYSEKHTVSRLIGAAPGYIGYGEGGQLSEKVRRRPYSVVLFDEIEKAHADVYDLFLQILDEGFVTDTMGRKIDFRNTCVIMTSNTGAQSIIEPKTLGFSAGATEEDRYNRMKDGVMSAVKRTFKPEFINRIDEVIVFRSLGKEQMLKIAGIEAAKLEKRIKENTSAELKVQPSAVKFIAEKGYDPKFGARPMRRAIAEHIEKPLTELLLKRRNEGLVKVTAKAKDGKVVLEEEGAPKASRGVKKAARAKAAADTAEAGKGTGSGASEG